MGLERCKNCGEYAFMDKHFCPPEWQVLIPDYHDNFVKGFGCDSEAVAERYIEKHFSDLDYPEECEIWIRKDISFDWVKFDVLVSSVPSFSATRKKEGGGEGG